MVDPDDEMLQIAERVVNRANGGADMPWAHLFQRTMRAYLEAAEVEVEDRREYCDLAEGVSIALAHCLLLQGAE